LAEREREHVSKEGFEILVLKLNAILNLIALVCQKILNQNLI